MQQLKDVMVKLASVSGNIEPSLSLPSLEMEMGAEWAQLRARG